MVDSTEAQIPAHNKQNSLQWVRGTGSKQENVHPRKKLKPKMVMLISLDSPTLWKFSTSLHWRRHWNFSRWDGSALIRKICFAFGDQSTSKVEATVVLFRETAQEDVCSKSREAMMIKDGCLWCRWSKTEVEKRRQDMFQKIMKKVGAASCLSRSTLRSANYQHHEKK